jgi:glucose/mannose-6-phosphate isomerase
MEDNTKLLKIMEMFPEELITPFAGAMLKKHNAPKKILICGMGGSGIAGDVIKDIFKGELDIQIVRDYTLPTLKEKMFVIICSYSGNTEETISCLENAIERKHEIVAISSGGQISEICKQKRIDWVELKPDIPPRTAFPNLFASILHVLETKGLISQKNKEIGEFVKTLDMKVIKERAQKIAESINGRMPVIYTYDFPSVAKRIKDEFNENSKIQCRYEVFPELNHNDVNGWLNRKMADLSKIIILRSNDEPARIAKVMSITEKLLRDNVDIIEVQMQGKTRLQKALTTILTFDIASVMLADMNNVDAYSVKLIDKFKELLKQ